MSLVARLAGIGRERNFANGRYLAAYESGDNERREGRSKAMRVPSRGIPRG